MKIIGCDFHTRYQQIAMLDKETGELMERRLEHENGEARTFYAQLAGPVRVGIEATGYTHWFERMLAELGHELWIGDAAKIRASVVRKQKTDARDAAHMLELLVQRALSADLAADAGGAGPAATGVASAEAGVDANDGEEPTARAGHGRGRVPEEEVVHQGRARRNWKRWRWGRGRPAAARVAGDARSVGEPMAELDQAVEQASGSSAAGGAADDASGRGAGDLAGLRADDRAGRAFPRQQAGGELPGTESARELVRRTSSGSDRSASKATR